MTMLVRLIAREPARPTINFSTIQLRYDSAATAEETPREARFVCHPCDSRARRLSRHPPRYRRLAGRRRVLQLRRFPALRLAQWRLHPRAIRFARHLLCGDG